MKVKRAIGISSLSLIIILSLFMMMGINAQPTESIETPAYLPPLRDMPDHEDYNESSYGTFSYTLLNNKENMQGFYSNYTNMFHYWGDMGRDVTTHADNVHDVLGYAYSPDGVNWNVNPYWGLGSMIDFASSAGRFDVVLETNGRDFWLVSLNNFHTEPHLIYAKKGYLLLNGSLRWYQSKQTVVGGILPGGMKVTHPIDAEVDSNGRLFVSYNAYYVSGRTIYVGYVRWTENTNGIFTSDGQACFDTLLSWNKGDYYREYLKLNRLADGKMAWTGIFQDDNPLWWVQTNYFDGVNWLVDQNKNVFSSAATEGNMYRKVDIVSYGDHQVIAYTRRSVGFQRLFIKEAFYDSGWTNSTELISNYPELTGTYVPHLTATWDGNIMLFVYKSGSNILNYTYRFSNYTWVTPFIENILNVSDAVYNWNRFSFMDTTENIIPFWFQDNTTPYEWLDWSALQLHYFSWNGTLLPVVFRHYNTTLTDEFGNDLNGDWIFEGDIYTFKSYVMGASTFSLNFSDGQHDIQLVFENSTGNMYIASGERFVIGEIYTKYTLHDDGTQELLWRFIPDINIVDITNTSVDYYWYSEEYDIEGYGYLNLAFNIYNLGGLTSYTFIGDGGRIAGGSPFRLYATDGNISSSARADQIFRKLQHISFLVELDMDNEWESGNGAFDIDAGVGSYEFGFDYRLNASWVEGFKIKIYVQDADVGHHNGGNDHNWIEWSIDFYNYDPNTGDVQNLQSQLIYSNHWGYDHENYNPDYHNRTSSQLWIDLWFDKTNASTTVGVQVNSMYYGNKEQGSAWWFGYGVFTPMISEYDNAKFLDDLYDEGGNITNIQKYELIRFWAKVEKVNITDGNDETWSIRQVEDMHRELAIDRMEGIDEPTFVQTKIIDMPQTGFINALKSAINGLSKLIWAGAFQFVKLLMGAVGSLMDAIGLGAWWIAFNTILGRLATFSLNLMEQLQISLINSALLLTQIFNLVSAGLGRFIGSFTWFVSSILEWYQGIIDLFTGSGGIFNVNIWRDLGLGDWIILAVHLLPVWWIDRLAKAKSLGETAKSDLQFVVWIVSGLFGFLVTIIMLSVDILNMLLGLLPI